MQWTRNAQACDSTGTYGLKELQRSSNANITKASIDYLRYLERCITELKTANRSNSPVNTQHQQQQQQPPSQRPPIDTMAHDEPDSDEEMSDDNGAPATGQATPSTIGPSMPFQPSLPSLPSLPSFSQLTTNATISSSIRAYDQRYLPGRHFSISSTSTSAPTFSSHIHSQNTSPVFGPAANVPGLDASTLALTSPALRAQDQNEANRQGQRDDREAMAALLMLNCDRRSRDEYDRERGSSSRGSTSSRGTGKPGGGMSVRDLLSH